jgi:serine/threonine protein kinase
MTEKRRAADLAPGSLLAERYRIASVVGRGGLATVYRADDESLHRTVALKVIHGSLGDVDAARRHEDEVRLVAGFNHPGLVTLFDVVTLDENDNGGHVVLIMQFVDGADLSSRLKRGAIGAELAAEIGADVADALAYIHGRGVMHRDVKPANILLPAAGNQVAMLADFGIARIVDESGITSTGLIVGTANYLSPEQAAGATLSPATDIYSLGLVLLECLTGKRAFPGSAVESVAARLSADPEIPAEVAQEWRVLLQQMLSREPEERPSAAEVATGLRGLAGNGTGPTKLLPVAGGTTERLVPAKGGTTELLAPAAAAAPVRTARRPPAWLPAVLIALGIAVLSVIGFLILTSFLSQIGDRVAPSTSPTSTSSQTPSAAPISYPRVDGPLGERLVDLQNSVASLQSEDASTQLQAFVLKVTEYSASGDYEAAQASLDDLRDAVDDSTLTAGERDDILTAIDGVRTELEELLDPHDGPGKSDHKKKP